MSQKCHFLFHMASKNRFLKKIYACFCEKFVFLVFLSIFLATYSIPVKNYQKHEFFAKMTITVAICKRKWHFWAVFGWVLLYFFRKTQNSTFFGLKFVPKCHFLFHIAKMWVLLYFMGVFAKISRFCGSYIFKISILAPKNVKFSQK